ncbi:hypothetical protein ACHHV8_12295 [Paenibacillus sp. TAB 01]|uniref:hypothetical protein n=1 Tax=Paenibacillus sp. TAB 01 TaxID=3368988 RepID=UPI0037530D1D
MVMDTLLRRKIYGNGGDSKMRMVVAYITIFLLSIAFLIATDMLTGMDLTTAVEILKESFSVTTREENMVIVILLLLPLLIPFVTYMRGRRKKTGSLRNPD